MLHYLKNLVSGSVQCSRGYCTVIEERSLVLARDDVSGARCKMASCKVKREAGFTR